MPKTHVLVAQLENVPFHAEPVLGFAIPEDEPGVLLAILSGQTWHDPIAARVDSARRSWRKG